MSLAHALITSLLEKPTSGFDLARRFDKSIGFFWQATHQQIYRELARMESLGWIQSEAAPDGGKTRKRLYQVLPSGETELRTWAQTPTRPSDLRDELMVRLRADAVLGPLGLEQELTRRMQEHQANMARYQAIELHDFPAHATLSRAQRLQHTILKTGIAHEANWARWCEEALAVLRSTAD